MKNIVSLKSKLQFDEVYQSNKSFANRYLVMYICQNGLDYNRIGLSVSKKVGNSVVRHRATRLIRESYRLNMSNIKIGYDIVIVARPNIIGKTYAEVESAFIHLLKLHKLYINNP